MWINKLFAGFVLMFKIIDVDLKSHLLSLIKLSSHGANLIIVVMGWKWNEMNRALGQLCAHIG